MASNLSQESLPIAFVLLGGDGFIASYIPLTVIFDSQLGVIKPENLSYIRPARRALYNTASRNTAFLDDWGEGIGRLMIAGHTGWTSGTIMGGNFTGLGLLKLLETMITQYWTRRQVLSESGALSPDTVQLYIFDAVNMEALALYPDSFSLTRSRTRPQLYMYSMQFTVLADLFETAIPGIAQYVGDFLQPSAGTSANTGAASASLASVSNLSALAPLLAAGIAFA